jgi:hypothetical protein
MTPNGQLLEGYHSNSFCTVRFNFPGIAKLSDAISDLINEFENNEQIFQKLKSKNVQSSLFIGWFSSGNSGDVLEWRLLERLGRLGISLEFDVYDGAESNDQTVTE